MSLKIAFVILLVFGFVGLVHGQTGVCPSVAEAPPSYGPWDYTNPDHRERRLPVVEQHHFGTGVEHLRNNPRSIAGDLSYTLNTFPNHHRALHTLVRFAIQEGTTQPGRMSRTLDCWFHRAAGFNPEDGMVHMIHGMYYYQKGDLDTALEKMERGRELEPRNPNILYNLGLVRAKRGEYERARELAEEAYNMGIPLPGLRNQLKRAGHWDD